VQREAQFAQSLAVLAAGLARLGAALTGALTGLKADIATRGLTFGGGLLAGGLLHPLVEAAARAVLAGLYPGTRSDSPAE
jgi:ribulose 1,5-bisphosphate synthetase/thiazole synthase